MDLDLFSDAQLMLMFRHGRADAFRAIFDRHRDRVYRLALRMTGDKADAEELVQETFLRVARAADRYEPRAAFTTWLHRIALNACLTHTRRTQHSNVVRLEAHHGHKTAPPDNPQAIAEAREVAELLQTALLAIDPTRRSAFVLRVCEGLPYDEVSEIMATPTATIRTHVHRARAELRTIMARTLRRDTPEHGRTP